MNWWSEAALLWLPEDGQAYPADFAVRAAPGTSDFYYLAIDAFEAVIRERSLKPDLQPWVYILDEGKLLSPSEVAECMVDWRLEFDRARSSAQN